VGPKAVEKTPVKFTKTIFLFVILAALFASGLAVRRAVLAAQYERYGRPLPFDLESALNFRYVRMLRESGSLPVVDKRVQYPAGVVVRQTYQTGTEFICAFLARFFPAGVPLDERVRWISAAWFCLGIPALALWIWWWQGSLWGAVLAGSYYALSLAGVIRSTGEELSHENFALPLLVFQFAVSALADREKARLVRFVCLSGLSAILLACALMIWDLIQYYVMIWALLGFIRAVRGEYYMESRRLLKWGLALAALLLAGVFNPYLRAHGFIFSPAMLLAYGAALAVLVARWQGKENAINIKKAGPDCQSGRKDGATGCRAPDLCSGRSLERQVCRKPGSKQKIAVLLRLTIAFLPLVAGYFLCRAYLQSYDHFAELLYAKIIFLNSKPADPTELTFAQRILWTPALNSASILLTKTLFPVSLILFLVSTIIFLFNPRWRTDPEITGLFLFTCMSLIAFILFVRFHVFAAIGFAAVIGLLGAWAVRRVSLAARVLLVLLISAGAVAEGTGVLRHPERWGTSQPYLRQRVELVQWLKANAPGQPVLANFGISAFALAYAGSPIILHPKFESPEIRNLVQEYGEKLFKSDEGQFRSWADRHGAALYIYALGEFADIFPEAQMRYFVDALNPPPASPARMFEFNPMASRWFVLLWGNPKYRVFRIITAGDEKTAATKAAAARAKIAGGFLKEAEIEAEHALLYDPGNKSAQEAILQVDALKKK
jgi:uncharacterized membrane protein YqjE